MAHIIGATIRHVMSGLGTLAATLKRRIGWLIRDRFPNRRVTRDVQGVRMVLPWSHRLPDYAGHGSIYGQNLVELARALAADSRPLAVLDVGANVGDSALQILNAVEARVLCVEGDVAYLEYLHLNVGSDPRVSIVEGLLTVDATAAGATAVRSGGTTRFVEGNRPDAMPSVTPSELRRHHPEFDNLRLVKSDTDGYDVALIPAIAEAWRVARPVLFFEYDPHLVELAGLDRLEVWQQLAALGYHDVLVWSHGGKPVGHTSVSSIGAQAAVLDNFPKRRPSARSYWDVAVVHRDDAAAQEALGHLVPRSLRV